MRVQMRVSGALLLAFAVAACGGGSPTQAPAGATQNPAATQDGGGGTETQGPAATQSGDGGGGGSIDTTYGKVHIEISGPVTKSADYGFLPSGSVFGGSQGSVLNFGGDSSAVSVLINADGSVVVSWTTTEFQAPATECTTTNWNVGASSGSGSFECTAGLVIMGSGAMAADGKVKGNFTAHT